MMTLNTFRSSSPSPSSSSSCSCSSAPLFPTHIPPLDSPPDSPATPWRPGSTAYPSYSSSSSLSSTHTLPSSTSTSGPPSFQQAKLELQRLYEALSEGAYDLSLRDIVDVQNSLLDQDREQSVGGGRNEAVADDASDESATLDSSQTFEKRDALQIECDEGVMLMEEYVRDGNGGASSKNQSSNNRSSLTSTFSSRESSKNQANSTKKKKQQMQKQKQRSAVLTPSCSVRSSCCRSPLVSSSAKQKRCQLAVSCRFLAVSCRFLRVGSSASAASSSSSSSCSSSSLSTRSNQSKKYASSEQRSAIAITNASKIRSKPDQLLQKSGRSHASGAGIGGSSSCSSSSRVHPSSQCSACASYTVFFKSRCMVCSKLYCSNCAKDAMDSASDGRRCKATCAHLVRTSRFSATFKTKCWPLCGNVDVMKIAQK